MPSLTTEGGKPVDVTAEQDAINDRFRQAMNDDGPDDQAPPPRADKPDGEKPKPRRGRPPKSEQARTTAKPATALDDNARSTGVQGLAQVGAALLLGLSKATGKDAFQADAVTVVTAAPQIAEACVQVARQDARFAAALDKVCSSGPYAALISVGVQVGMQCVRNHRPALTLPGTVHPDQLLEVPVEQAA